jgi:MinD-like ATPase involved in chromosome partitioning or flagellar assembly
MVEGGHNELVMALREENSGLKDVLTEMQECLQQTINECVSAVSRLDTLQESTGQMKQLADLIRKITPSATKMKQDMVLLDLPRGQQDSEFY